MLEDTSKRTPERHLLGAIVEGPERYITGMEAAGQQELVAADDVLPALVLHCTQQDFERLGFEFGDLVEEDPLFRRVTLPAGWQKRATEHDMWSEVVDETGTARVSVFYKAAFYDRRAHMWLTEG